MRTAETIVTENIRDDQLSVRLSEVTEKKGVEDK
jgi:hypothetical protein